MKRFLIRDTIVDYLFCNIVINLKLLSVICLKKKVKVLNLFKIFKIFYSTDGKNVQKESY